MFGVLTSDAVASFARSMLFMLYIVLLIINIPMIFDFSCTRTDIYIGRQQLTI